MTEVRSILTSMLAKLDSSHYAIIPAGEYESDTRSGIYNDTQKDAAAPPAEAVQSADSGDDGQEAGGIKAGAGKER